MDTNGKETSGLGRGNNAMKFEEMGWHAYKAGIKDCTDDPAYTMAILAESKDYTINPHDDWNQGWLLAAFHFKKLKEEEDARNETTDNGTED